MHFKIAPEEERTRLKKTDRREEKRREEKSLVARCGVSRCCERNHRSLGYRSLRKSGIMSQPMVDDKDRQQFLELQKKMLLETNKLKKLESQTRTSEVEKRKCQLTLQELETLPEGVNTYRTIGRTFVLVDKNDMATELKQSIQDNEEFVGNSKDKKVYLEKQVKDAEEEIRELLRSTPALAKQIAGVAG